MTDTGRGIIKQYVGFTIGTGDYMLPILNVREIINMPPVTSLPQLPAYIKGITNLRDSIIPIIDTCQLLNSSIEEEGKAVIVITTGKIAFGIIVGGIAGVINVEEDRIEPPENFFNNNIENIEGVAKLNDKLIILLDIKKLLPMEDMSLLEDTILDVKETGDGSNVEVTREIETVGGRITTTEFRNAKEFMSKNHEKNDMRDRMFEMVLSFMDAIAAHDYQKAETILNQLMKDKDSHLFSGIGKITRRLHDSLEDFKGSLETGLQKLSTKDVPNAVDNLQFVISKTEDAANRTMGIVERYFEESEEFSKHLKNIKDNNEDVEYIKAFKDALDSDMTTILTAQEFQDLTGQTIRKVIALVNNIEVELLNLITKFGMQTSAGQEEVEEKAASAEESTEKVSQSDVEALLNEFGF